MARKNTASSVAIDVEKFKQAVAALEKLTPSRFSLTRLPPFYLEALTPRFREGFFDEEIIAIMEKHQVGDEHDLQELVQTLRAIFEAAEAASKKRGDQAPASAAGQAKADLVGAGADAGATALSGKRAKSQKVAAALSPAAKGQGSALSNLPERPSSQSGDHPVDAAEANAGAAVSIDVTTGVSAPEESEEELFKIGSGS
ncbi:hypothetical protein CCR94_07215 [Rhodoblastus sphagnicola]|uniref:Uncharacterized protein n=1 Tax=Rhodoblastus sphagnicola TaxID=333368 RepID=A0A2S6NBM3_9HYPH|nr:hypothetical protein [Rhodoblastus sphagnicola]MBB4199644.1 hypothetical protein [Rhodoblastus sphagnicola]PPQ31991.1 hypothetical protein CCR94_07215 [Rhodoblastus sphagnicola]